MNDYPDPSEFLADARKHMRKWVNYRFGVEPSDSVSVTIPRNLAAVGANFWGNGNVVETVKNRFPNAFINECGRRSVAGDALCSAHVPFNLFAPLVLSKLSQVASQVFSEIIGIQVQVLNSIQFEYPTKRGESPIQDNTAFDTYILATCDNRLVQIGIEVKFTEGPYSWGKTEKRQMFDSSSLYNRLTASSVRFKSGAPELLRNRHLKQMWRNMLLAEQFEKQKNASCYYVHLFPKQNSYQAAATSSFANTLSDKGQKRFKAFTYEEYFQLLKKSGANIDWCNYLIERYEVAV